MLNRRLAGIATALLTFGLLAHSASAQTEWQKNHPVRAKDNGRLAVQNARIKEERATGQINGAQAAALHKEDHQIRQEEKDMASQHGTHLTKADQHVLNQQENAVSKQIGK